MGPGSRKRKHRSHRSPSDTEVKFLSQGYNNNSTTYNDHSDLPDESDTKPDPLHALYIQAYEADIVRGPHAKAAAQSLEVVEYSSLNTIIPKIGSALIRWGGDTTSIPSKSYRDDEDDMLPPAVQGTEIPIWVDRYDARLLLDTLPKPGESTVQPDSPSGWSDLPSDTEDTFFFTPDETENFRRAKRRRLIEQTREERLRARMEEDDVEEENLEEEDIWGGSDEEPDDPQQELMRRTATHLLSSPNAAQLEMRILANYGSDKRFAFLRGRWSRRWSLVKLKARLDKEKDQMGKGTEKSQASLGLVTAYGSDDSEEGDRNMMSKGKDVTATAAHSAPVEPPDSMVAVEEAAKEARRKRAKEWAEKRRETKSKDETM